MDASGIDLILASTPNNVRYFSDYYRDVATEYDVLWSSTATHKTFVGIPKDQTVGAFLVLGAHEQTGIEVANPWIKERRFWGPGYYIKNWKDPSPDPGNPIDVVADILREKGVDEGCVGLNMRFLGASYFSRLRELLPKMRIIDVEPVIWELRRIKTPEEIKRIRKACEKTCRAWAKVMNQRFAGMTEKKMRDLFIKAFTDEGLSDGRFFCMFGPTPGNELINGSPLPSATPLIEGQFSRVDLHGKYMGYTSDLSRAIAFGEVSREMELAHATVKDTAQRLHNAVRPGLTGKELRDLELKLYESTKYPAMIPYTGHNIGMAIHEPPFLDGRENVILETGMVISIEPTIMYSEAGGDIFIAIEDTVLITDDGNEILTADAPMDLYLCE